MTSPTQAIKRYGLVGEYDDFEMTPLEDGDYIKASDIDPEALRAAIDAFNANSDAFDAEVWRPEQRATNRAANDKRIAYFLGLLECVK